MGYKFSYGQSGSATSSSLQATSETPEQEASRVANAINADAIRRVKLPKMQGSENQVNWALQLFKGEQYFWHGAGYEIADLNLFLQSPEARSAKWWIDSCKDSRNGMAGNGRIALDKVLDRLKQPAPTAAALSLKLKVGYPDRRSA